MRASPLGKSSVHRITRCPSLLSALRRSVCQPCQCPGRSGLQRAFLSVSSAQKCSGAGKLATPSGVSRAARSAIPCRSSVPGHRASRFKYTGLRTVVPLGGRAVYTALHGARLSSVPSGDQSANPAVFQGAAVSSERFSQSLPPRNVAELGGSPPLRGSLEQLDRPSPAGPPFQGTELAALSTPEASLKRLVPLVSHLAVWEPLPSVSYWVLPEQTLVP